MKLIRLLLIAVQFLTCIPVRLRKPVTEEEYGEALSLFPLVGLLIGLLLVLLEYVLSYFLPGAVVRLFLVGFLVFITHGLHIDGLADTTDALSSGRGRDESLMIMKESTIGPMGVVAVFLCLAVKYAVFMEYFGLNLYKVLLFFPVAGRMAVVCVCRMFPYARTEGTGKIFIGKGGAREFTIAGVMSLLFGFLLFGLKGVIILGCVFILTIVTGKYFQRKFGGITGDNAGFINEMGELTALIGVTLI